MHSYYRQRERGKGLDVDRTEVAVSHWEISQDVLVIRAQNPLPNHVVTAILATSKNIIHSAGIKMRSEANSKKVKQTQKKNGTAKSR